MFLPKSFIETVEGLRFAVVAEGVESGKIRCFLRYVANENRVWRKVNSDEANRLLKQNYPDYCFHSIELDASLHAVPIDRIVAHYDPYQGLQNLLASRKYADLIEKDCIALCDLFEQESIKLQTLGITGSLLVKLQKDSSDIDLVCNNLDSFHHCRLAINTLLLQEKLQPLSQHDWQESYRRRDCALNFDEYVWHEIRKDNKALINGRKFDLSLVENNADSTNSTKKTYSKQGIILICAQVTDDKQAFSYPAEFKIDHPSIQQVVCFTATYVGQALVGETIEVAGQLEQDEMGNQRIVVGSNREAHGQYIKQISVIL